MRLYLWAWSPGFSGAVSFFNGGGGGLRILWCGCNDMCAYKGIIICSSSGILPEKPVMGGGDFRVKWASPIFAWGVGWNLMIGVNYNEM